MYIAVALGFIGGYREVCINTKRGRNTVGSMLLGEAESVLGKQL